MCLGESGVVPADFPGGALRMSQEVEIVDGHNLCPRSGGQQERVRRVHDIVAAAGEGFDGWPLQAVPGEIQHPDRDAPVRRTHAGQFVRKGRRQPVLPRA